MTRSIRFLPVVALVLATLTAAFAFSPRAVAAGRTPEQIAEANRVKAQQLADKALLSIEKALGKSEGRFDNLYEAAVKNIDKLLDKNVRDFAKYQKAVAAAVTNVNKDSAKTLAGAAKTILATQKAITKLNQPEVLATFLGSAGQKVAAFAAPSAEAIARLNDRLQEVAEMLQNLEP
jgi:transcriptional regulator of heat shock response